MSYQSRVRTIAGHNSINIEKHQLSTTLKCNTYFDYLHGLSLGLKQFTTIIIWWSFIISKINATKQIKIGRTSS